MRSNTRVLAARATLALALLGFGLAPLGCSTTSDARSAAPSPATQSGATLWAQDCGHCHNFRSPDSYSDAQWEVAALHMRVRANLTAQEHEQILAFLRSAH